MKSLRDFLINEKLIINKNTKLSKGIRIPKYDNSADYEFDEDNIWRTLDIPIKKYIIYYDLYRYNSLHFAVLPDFLGQLIWCQEDYEDFEPESGILYASDDLQDAFNFYIKALGIPKKCLQGEYSDIIKKLDDFFDKTGKRRYIVSSDSNEFFARVALGEWKDDELFNFFSEKDIDKIAKDFPNFVKNNIVN